MASKREQRLRRRARAQLRAAERSGETELQKLRDLKAVATYAIRYVGAIDAPNPHEPWDIAKRRDDLVAVVHEHQGKPGKWRCEGEVVPLRPAAIRPANLPVATKPARFSTQPLPRTAAYMAPEQLVRDAEVKRRELHNAAKKLGAAANQYVLDHARIIDLEAELDAAAKAYTAAVTRLHTDRADRARAAGGAA